VNCGPVPERLKGSCGFLKPFKKRKGVDLQDNGPKFSQITSHRRACDSESTLNHILRVDHLTFGNLDSAVPRPHMQPSLMLLGEQSKIMLCVRKASLLKFISFCRDRLRLTEIVKYLPELAPMLNLFGKHSHLEWAYEMFKHNQSCTTPAGVCCFAQKKMKPFRYISLDLFLLREHPEKLAEVLDSWAIFAARVAPLIRINTDAHSWKLNRKIVIHRRHWLLLSKRVMNLVLAIGLLSGVADHLDSRSPGHNMLKASASRAARMYGGFVQGKRFLSCLPNLT
jgi:hypothetical protein